MDEETRIRIAEKDLEKYRDTMITFWGNDYRSNVLYTKVVREVAAGRYPRYALFDCLGL